MNFLCVRHAGARWRAGHPEDKKTHAAERNAKGIAKRVEAKRVKKNQAVLEKNTVEWVVSSDRLNAPSAAAGERKTTAMVTKAVT
jgi:hypothetical protein